jgi:putative ABC transport system substrate-binding protein
MTIGRREFIVGGGAAAAWPIVARAQQSAIPMIGLLSTASPETWTENLAAFRSVLADAGYVEGRNVVIEYRWAHGRYDRLPALATDLVARRVVLIVTGPTPGAVAAKAATTTIPILFTSGVDPVAAGLVENLNRPNSNLTGVSLFSMTLLAKRMELLHQLVPKSLRVGILVNPDNPNTTMVSTELPIAAHTLGLQSEILSAANDREMEAVFAQIAGSGIDSLFASGDPFFFSSRQRLVALATRYGIPTAFEQREFPQAGALMSYGSSLPDAYRTLGGYAVRILKGEKLADLPVIQPTKFELVINLKTAKALGLTVPPTLLAIADEVVE